MWAGAGLVRVLQALHAATVQSLRQGKYYPTDLRMKHQDICDRKKDAETELSTGTRLTS